MNDTLLAAEVGVRRAGGRALGVYVTLVSVLVIRQFSTAPLIHVTMDGVILLVLCGWAWTWWDEDGSRRVLKLLSFFNAVFYGIVGLMLVAFEVWPDALRPEWTTLLYRQVGKDPLSVLDEGLLLVILVQAIFLIVWAFPSRPAKRHPGWVWLGEFFDSPWIIASTFAAYVVGELAPHAVPSSLLNVIITWGLLVDLAIAARFVRWLRDEASLVTWLPLVFSKAAVGVFTGWRGRLLELSALILIAFVAERGRLPVRWLAFTGAVFMLALLPFLIGYRSVLWGSEANGVGGRFAAASAALSDTGGESWTDRFLTSYRFLAVRLGGERIDELSGVAAQDVRLNGGSLWPFLTAPIPRAVWPTKPILSPELNKIALVLKKSPSANSPNPQTSMVWTQYTDLYLNFGVPGLAFGAVLIALFARWLNRLFLQRPATLPVSVGIFVVLFEPLWKESTMGYVFQSEVQILMVFGVIHWIMRTVRETPRSRDTRTLAIQ